MIYLILCAGFKDNNPDQFEKRLKIGYTDNLENRLKAYQVANPGFILLDTREGDTRVESYLHKKFEKYRYSDNSREWFHYSQEIIDNFHCDPEEIIDKDTLLKYINNVYKYIFYCGLYNIKLDKKMSIKMWKKNKKMWIKIKKWLLRDFSH